MEDAPIVPVLPPWTLKGTCYVVTFKSKAEQLPDHTYSPLERDSAYASPSESGKHLGGLSLLQIIRYTESPVGPYDELIVCPGYYTYDVEENGKRRTMKNARISRIYVSQKYTCWNGRTNWNIPKHLAKFEFEDLEGGVTKVRVYPHDTTGDITEAQPSKIPFFQATFQPIRWTPTFPFSTSWLKYLGFESSLVQPPLPALPNSKLGELPGTDRWCRINPLQVTKRASVGWTDLSQKNEKGEIATSVKDENFWPDLGRWQLAVKLDDCEIGFGEGIYWGTPKTRL
ncbi:hypothetical protein GGR57DRAFT_411544 [Xylariaceae sp. FL1272]|nr:hypothetical protein GGR57DRAFT_411544 [Xylariaceae sp. FL1272]